MIFFFCFLTTVDFCFVVLQVVSPYSAEDARGLIKAAVRDNDPGILYEILLCITTILYVRVVMGWCKTSKETILTIKLVARKKKMIAFWAVLLRTLFS